MARRLLTRIADLALAHPWVVVLVTALPCVVLSVVGLRAPKDLSFTGIMDRSDPLVAAYYRMSEKLAFAGRLPLLLEGPDDKLDDAARALEPALEAHPRIDTVIRELPTKWLEERAPWFVDRPLFDAWVGLATRPGDAAGPKLLEEGLRALEEERARASPKGARLVLVRMKDDFMDLEAGGAAFLEIEQQTKAVLAPFGVTGTYGGLPAIAAQDQSRTMTTVQVLSPLSLLLVLFLFRLVERSFWRLLAVATPMLLTVGATLGLVSLLTGELTVMETFFGVMVFGLGVDFALHLMVRLREERARDLPFAEALRTTWWGTGTSVISGGLTTAGAFFLCAFAPDPLALHLGLSGGIGLGVCLLLMLVLLPALLVLVERRSEAQPASAPVQVPFLRPVVLHAIRHPKRYVALALFFVVGAGYGSTTYHFETDLSKVFNREVPALRAMDRIQELFGVSPIPYLVLAEDLDEARRVTKGFESEPIFDRVDSAARFFPEDLEERRQILTTARDDVATQRAVYEGLLPLTTDAEAETLKGALRLLAALDRALEVGPPRLDALPAALAADLLGPDGEIVVYAYVKEPSIDGLRAREERLAAQRVDEDVVGFGFLLEAIMAQDRPWVWPVLFGILALVGLILLVDLRRPKLVVLALAPVVFGTVVAFGALCLAGLAFNVLTTLVVPLLIGLGVDDGIHVTHRIREEVPRALSARVTSVGRAIFMTTATTCVSFVTLLFTDHAGLEGMALVVLVGLPLCLVASITLVPALAVLLGVADEGTES